MNIVKMYHQLERSHADDPSPHEAWLARMTPEHRARHVRAGVNIEQLRRSMGLPGHEEERQVKHSISTIVAALEKSIAAHDAREAKAHEERLAARATHRRDVLKRRSDAATWFVEIGQQLAAGRPLNERQSERLHNFARNWRHKKTDVILNDLTEDLDAQPKLNQHPAPEWQYELLRVLQSLLRDNDGQTTVSTSFLKDAGFGGTVLAWVTRI